MTIYSYTYIEVKNFDIDYDIDCDIQYNIIIYIHQMLASPISGAICCIPAGMQFERPASPPKQVTPKFVCVHIDLHESSCT